MKETYDHGIEAALVSVRGVDSPDRKATFRLTCSGNVDLSALEAYRCDPPPDVNHTDMSLRDLALHPLLQEFLAQDLDKISAACSRNNDCVPPEKLLEVFQNVAALVAGSRTCYRLFTVFISRWLENTRGYDPEKAEEHARAASIGLLVSATSADHHFNASVEYWRYLCRIYTELGKDEERRVLFKKIRALLP
jgi:hypothetical protein